MSTRAALVLAIALTLATANPSAFANDTKDAKDTEACVPSFGAFLKAKLMSFALPFPGALDFYKTHAATELAAMRRADRGFDLAIREERISYKEPNFLMEMLPSYRGENKKKLPELEGITTYLKEPQKLKFQAQVIEGELRSARGQIYSNQVASFTIDPQGRIYIFSCDMTMPWQLGLRVQHSSFTDGGPVLAAGLIRFNKDGSLRMIEPNSGHYKPSDTVMPQVLTLLKKAGVKLGYVQIKTVEQMLNPQLKTLLKR